MKYVWRGLQDYQTVYDQQRESLNWTSFREEIWGLEHPLVLTLGRRAKIEDEVPARYRQGVPVVSTDRGGLATLHGPGQLVIYPLVSLGQRKLGPREYVCLLLKITKNCLLDFGISAELDRSQSGLFVAQKKICFVGLRLSGGRSYHGLSLNISNDLSHFDEIRSCGVAQRPTASLKTLGVVAQPEEVFSCWQKIAVKAFPALQEGVEAPKEETKDGLFRASDRI